jgi:predicted ATPase/class 3 adenylate cyclase
MDDRLVFDPDAFELFRNGELVDIEPQALAVAAHLIEHRHRLVPKEELLDEVWGDRFVGESALTTRIKQVRRAMGDNGTDQRVVKTVHGKGYRFVGEIDSASASADPSDEAPSGTVTFLFTDVEGSTALWQDEPARLGRALDVHGGIIRTSVDQHDGHVFTTAGNSFAIAFARAKQAIDAAVEMQRELATVEWPVEPPLRVRMGLHTGEARELGGDYFGSAVNRAARVMSLARGGQVLASAATQDVGRDVDLGDVEFVRLRPHRLDGLANPETLFRITGPGLPDVVLDGIDDDDGSGDRSLAHNLPRLRTELIGRDPEMEVAATTIEHNRLTTMVGVGGVGKTTLAVAAGRTMLDAFADGVWFVDLIPVSDADQLPLAIAKAAGLNLGTGDALDQVAGIVGDRRMLFVLDNCEHVIDAVTEIVDRLLSSTSGPRFLLTSREPLGLPDEARLVVKPLPTDLEGAAVQLLGACAARYGFTDVDRSIAADVCRELDGLPLAIELAAAQLRHLTLPDLAVRLDRRFDLLVGPRRDRHSSLATVLETTWASIEVPEHEVLRQLAACPGPIGLDDVIELMDQPESTTLNALGRLIDCSLLVRSTDRGEYRMLETVRAFARDNDGDMQHQRRERLADWCLGRVGANVIDHAFDFGLAHWCRTHDDILDAAEAQLAADRPDDAAMLIAAQGLAMHLDDGGRAADVLTRLDRHLDRIDDPALRARVHITGAYAAMAARGADELASHGTAAVAEARRCADDSILGIALVLQSWSAIRDPDRALELVAEAAATAEAAGDRRTLHLAEGYRAWHLTLMRRYDEAAAVARDVLARAGAERGYDTLCAAASLATCLALTDPQEALRVHERFIDQAGPFQMMANDVLLATSHAADADIDATARIVTRTYDRVVRAGHALPDLLVPLAALADSIGDAERARTYTAAIRSSSRPTQSLQATCLYQQLRAKLATVDEPVDDHLTSSDAVGAGAMEWLEALAERSAAS